MQVEYMDAEGKKKTKTIVYKGLGTWRCARGCRDKRGKTPVRRDD